MAIHECHLNGGAAHGVRLRSGRGASASSSPLDRGGLRRAGPTAAAQAERARTPRTSSGHSRAASRHGGAYPSFSSVRSEALLSGVVSAISRLSPARVKQSTATRAAASVAIASVPVHRVDDDPDIGLTRRDALPTRAHRVELHTPLALIALSMRRRSRFRSRAPATGPTHPCSWRSTSDRGFGSWPGPARNLRPVAHLEVELEVRLARRAQHEALTHEFHAINGRAQSAST